MKLKNKIFGFTLTGIIFLFGVIFFTQQACAQSNLSPKASCRSNFGTTFIDKTAKSISRIFTPKPGKPQNSDLKSKVTKTCFDSIEYKLWVTGGGLGAFADDNGYQSLNPCAGAMNRNVRFLSMIPSFSFNFSPIIPSGGYYQIQADNTGNGIFNASSPIQMAEDGGFSGTDSNSIRFNFAQGGFDFKTTPIYWRYRPVFSISSSGTASSVGSWYPTNVTKLKISDMPPPEVDPKTIEWDPVPNAVFYTIEVKHKKIPTYVPDLGFLDLSEDGLTPHHGIESSLVTYYDYIKITPKEADCEPNTIIGVFVAPKKCSISSSISYSLDYQESSIPIEVRVRAGVKNVSTGPVEFYVVPPLVSPKVLVQTVVGMKYGSLSKLPSRTAVWDNISGANTYQVDLSTDPNFKAMPADIASSISPSSTGGSSITSGSSVTSGITPLIGTITTDPYPIKNNQYVRQLVSKRTINSKEYSAKELVEEINSKRINLSLAQMVSLYGFANEIDAQNFIDHYIEEDSNNAYVATETAHPLMTQYLGTSQAVASGDSIYLYDTLGISFEDMSSNGNDIIISHPTASSTRLKIVGYGGYVGVKIGGIPIKISGIPNLANKSYINFGDLSIKTRYYWRVRTFNPSICTGSSSLVASCNPFGNWSSVKTFITGPITTDLSDLDFQNSYDLLDTDTDSSGTVCDLGSDALIENQIKTISSGGKTITWGASSGATSYSILVSDKADFSTIVKTQTGIKNSPYTISGLVSGQNYYYKLQAVNSFGSSAWSQVYSFKAE